VAGQGRSAGEEHVKQGWEYREEKDMADGEASVRCLKALSLGSKVPLHSRGAVIERRIEGKDKGLVNQLHEQNRGVVIGGEKKSNLLKGKRGLGEEEIVDVVNSFFNWDGKQGARKDPAPMAANQKEGIRL